MTALPSKPGPGRGQPEGSACVTMIRGDGLPSQCRPLSPSRGSLRDGPPKTITAARRRQPGGGDGPPKTVQAALQPGRRAGSPRVTVVAHPASPAAPRLVLQLGVSAEISLASNRLEKLSELCTSGVSSSWPYSYLPLPCLLCKCIYNSSARLITD